MSDSSASKKPVSGTESTAGALSHLYQPCPECGHDVRREMHEKHRDNDRMMHYRRALYAACNGDRATVAIWLARTEHPAVKPEPAKTDERG